MTARTVRRRVVLFGLLALVGVFVDLYSKWSVFARFADPAFRPPMPRPLLGGWATFELTTSFNEGALFGMGQGLSWLFAMLSLVAVAGVLYWLVWMDGHRSLWLTIALGLILAGTLGNLYDRLGLHGEQFPPGHPQAGEQRYAVRDFLLFTFGPPARPMPQRFHYPVFNFADAFLVSGALMLILRSLLVADDEQEEPRPRETTSSPATPGTDPPGPPDSPRGETAS